MLHGIGAALVSWLTVKVLRGRQWARVVFTLYLLIALPASLISAAVGYLYVYYVPSDVIHFTILFLLWLSRHRCVSPLSNTALPNRERNPLMSRHRRTEPNQRRNRPFSGPDPVDGPAFSLEAVKRSAPWILRAAAFIAALMVALTMVVVPAQADPGTSESGDVSGVESLVDRMVPAQLDDENIPGAVVTVVAGGKTLFSKGYGTANRDSDTPMKADTTGFYTASEAKLFTATAALQLVRQGKLDLHTDVNQYLDDLTIPNTYPGKPVTLHHLLTYTSGFDYDIYGWSQWKYDQMPALAEFTAQVQPDRVRPPGELTAYNNYDYVLIGRLIEIASGQPYADYVAEHVFQPLGMTGTTAQQPHPQRLQSQVATDYRPDGDGSQTKTAGQVSPATPAGGDTITTAPDMARFMSAQLRQGQNLGSGVAKLMQKQQFAADPRVPGMGYAFEQRPRNDHQVLFKDGDLPGIHHNLALLPDSDIGIHVVYNGDGTNGAAFWGGKELINKIIDTALGTGDDSPPEPHTADVSGYAGSYGDAGTSQTTFTAVTGLTSPITVETDGPAG